MRKSKQRRKRKWKMSVIRSKGRRRMMKRWRKSIRCRRRKKRR